MFYKTKVTGRKVDFSFSCMLTTNSCVLLQILASHVYVFYETLPGVSSSLFHGVFGTECTDCHVLEGKPQSGKAFVKFLSKYLSYLVALIL